LAGAHVNQGDLILQLDSVPMEINKKRLEETRLGLLTTVSALKAAINARNQQMDALRNQYAEIKRVLDDGFQNQKHAINAKNEHVKMLENQYQAHKKLFESGFLSRNALEKSRSELAWAQSENFDLGAKNDQVVTNTLQGLSAVNNQIALAQSEAMELKANLEQNQSRLKEVEQQLYGAEHDILLSKIIAPVAGTVMNLGVKTPGVPVTLGQRLLEIAPDSEDLIVEVRLPVDYADRIHEGLPVDVMFPTLAGSSTKKIKGKLDYLSGDKILDEKNNQAFFEARVTLLEADNITRGSLRAGLPATIMVRTGPRTLMSYILRPFTDRLSMGLQ